MTSETNKVKAKLAALSASFDDLEAELEPLFSQTLPETIIGLESIQKAKLQTVLPYLVYDLIFIYLKSKGIDPKTHPVVPELDRIRQYFEKISNAENPPSKRIEIDKAAAGRFIKHAITQATWTRTAAEEAQDEPEPTPARIPIKVTSKMVERAEYEKNLKEEESEEEEGLKIYEGNNAMVVDKEADVSHIPTGRKRGRPILDPFAGYGDDAPSPAEESSSKRVKSTLSNSGQTSSANILENPDCPVSPGSVPADPASAQTPNSNDASGSESLVAKTRKGKKKKGKKI